MAKLRHIAITVEDMEKTAAFYEQAFDMRRVREFPNSILLSDGVMSLAVLNLRNANAPGSTPGIHHMGFLVDDIDAVSRKVEANGGVFAGSIVDSEAASGGVNERKYRDPNGIRLDVSNATHATNVWKVPVS